MNDPDPDIVELVGLEGRSYGLVASGGWCVPVSPLYDSFRLREPWEYPDRGVFDGPDWHLLVSPRLTRAIRWWERRRSAAAAALTTYRNHRDSDHRDSELDDDL